METTIKCMCHSNLKKLELKMFLKKNNSKLGLRHVLSWPKLGTEPTFYETGTIDGFRKRAQILSDIQRKQTDRHTRFMIYKYRLS